MYKTRKLFLVLESNRLAILSDLDTVLYYVNEDLSVIYSKHTRYAVPAKIYTDIGGDVDKLFEKYVIIKTDHVLYDLL